MGSWSLFLNIYQQNVFFIEICCYIGIIHPFILIIQPNLWLYFYTWCQYSVQFNKFNFSLPISFINFPVPIILPAIIILFSSANLLMISHKFPVFLLFSTKIYDFITHFAILDHIYQHLITFYGTGSAPAGSWPIFSFTPIFIFPVPICSLDFTFPVPICSLVLYFSINSLKVCIPFSFTLHFFSFLVPIIAIHSTFQCQSSQKYPFKLPFPVPLSIPSAIPCASHPAGLIFSDFIFKNTHQVTLRGPCGAHSLGSHPPGALRGWFLVLTRRVNSPNWCFGGYLGVEIP